MFKLSVYLSIHLPLYLSTYYLYVYAGVDIWVSEKGEIEGEGDR